MSEKRFIGVEECAKYLDISRGTLYVWVCHKKIPYVKMGGCVKFDLIELEGWIKKRKVKPYE